MDVVYTQVGEWPPVEEMADKALIRVLASIHGEDGIAVELKMLYGCSHTKCDNILGWGRWWCAEDRKCPHHIKNRKVK